MLSMKECVRLEENVDEKNSMNKLGKREGGCQSFDPRGDMDASPHLLGVGKPSSKVDTRPKSRRYSETSLITSENPPVLRQTHPLCLNLRI